MLISPRLTFDELARRVAQWRVDGERIVLCHGCFDPLHPGHLLHFYAAREFGNRLIVTVSPDRYVHKGPDRPLFGEELRLAMIQELRIVDAAAINLWDGAVETIRELRPHVLVKGADYQDRSKCNPNIKAEEKVLIAGGGVLRYTDEVSFSATELVRRLREEART